MADNNDDLDSFLDEINVANEDLVDTKEYSKPPADLATEALERQRASLLENSTGVDFSDIVERTTKEVIEPSRNGNPDDIPMVRDTNRSAITYDLSERLFGYYSRGVTLARILQCFGQNGKLFTMNQLRYACEKYHWNERLAKINQTISKMNDKKASKIMAKIEDFGESLIDEAIIKKQSAIMDGLGDETGAVSITSVKDFETVAKIVASIAQKAEEAKDAAKAKDGANLTQEQVKQIWSIIGGVGDDEDLDGDGDNFNE